MIQGFSPVDHAIVGVYLLAMVAMGSAFFKGQKSTDDYFLAGRTIGWLPLALSIVATNLSGITFLGAPAIVFQKDLRYAMTVLLTPLVAILVVLLVTRLFYRLRLTTVYGYLEWRFGVPLRVLASLIFLLSKCGWLGAVLYTPALALSVVTGLPLAPCIVGMGSLATLYACLGGMKAVIWTDVVQFFVLVGGILVSLGVLLASFRWDLGAVWSIASRAGGTDHTRILDVSLGLTTEFIIYAIVLERVVWLFFDYGLNQIVVQRYFAARSLKDCIKGILVNSLLIVPIVSGLYLVGVCLVAYYDQHPDFMSSLMSLSGTPDDRTNRVFAHFMVYGLPVGLSGLVLVGLFAATLSSVDSAVNSLATVYVVDYYRRFGRQDGRSEAHYLKVARRATVVAGFVATLVALFVGRLGTILEIWGKIYGFFAGPLVGLFLLGLLSRRANQVGALAGLISGFGFVLLLSLGTDVHWLWRSPAGAAATLLSGWAFSFIRQAPRPDQILVPAGEGTDPPEPTSTGAPSSLLETRPES